MLLALCLITIGLPGVELAIRQFQTEYPGVIVCESTMDDTFSFEMPHSYMYVKGHLGGLHKCTHVEGNIVLRNIWPDPEEPDFSFLESIVEVSGMVVMQNNSISSVVLPKLRVIRGEHYTTIPWANRVSYNASLSVELVPGANSSHAVFPSLRVIMKNSVYFHTFRPHSHLPRSILWEELFEDPKHQQLLSINPLTEPPECHPSCSGDVARNLGNHCWSPSESHCQIRSKCVTTRKDGCKWCYFKRLENSTFEDCCNEDCSGGCRGKSSSQCLVCKNYVENERCVITCSREFVYRDGTWSKNPNFKLRVGMMCANSCPANLLEQGESCIYKCSTPQFYRMNNKCLPCLNSSACARTECNMKDFQPKDSRSFFMTKEVLSKFTNCEHVIGELLFTENSFDEQKGGITVPMLYGHLGKLKYITGNLMIAGSGPALENLTFLANLIEIRHQQTSSATAALNIVSTSLRFLGLRHLRHIYGRFEAHNNPELCYLDTLAWNEQILISNQFRASLFTPCTNKTCHVQCGPLGCWGPGAAMCYSCVGFRAGARCVTKCEDEPGLYTGQVPLNERRAPLDYDDGVCRTCSELCLDNCTGPGPDHCAGGGCRYLMENGRCVDNCSNGYYQRDKTCSRCNPVCVKARPDQPVCTGNGSFMGVGGCSLCHQFIQSESGRVLLCYSPPSCPSRYFAKHVQPGQLVPSDHPYSSIKVCLPCTKPCSKCSGSSLDSPSCEVCDGYWSGETCVSQCDADKLQLPPLSLTNTKCLYCHEQCRIGCHQPFNQSQCVSCRFRRIYDGEASLKQFSCLDACPVSHNYSYKDEDSQDILCVVQSQWETYLDGQSRPFVYSKILWVLGPVLLLLVVISVSFVYRFYQMKLVRSKQYIKDLYSNIQEPDSRSLLANQKHLPNMNRLQLIPKTNLHFNINEKPLGTGAFGAVYKGQWVFSNEFRSRSSSNTIDVAIKVIQANRDIDINDILDEMKVMASVCHKHCLRLIGVCLNYEMPCLVTSFVELGSLDKYLRKHKKELSSFNLLSWAEQIANGMAYLEMRNIIHRDLATRNVLLSNLNLVQITDFGLSQILQGTEANDEVVITRGQVPIRWLALETLISGVYSHKTDVWAYGVTLWEIFTYGDRPYDELDVKDISSFLLQNNRLWQPEICSVDLYSLLLRCWLEASQFRPGFEELMSCLCDYSRHPTFYLHIPNDPCLMCRDNPKPRLTSQCSYELHPFQRSKPIYHQQSLDGTVSTFIGDYSDDLIDSSLKRQYSNFSWTSKKYNCQDDIIDPKLNLLRYHSVLTEDLEECEPLSRSDDRDTEYLEPINK